MRATLFVVLGLSGALCACESATSSATGDATPSDALQSDGLPNDARADVSRPDASTQLCERLFGTPNERTGLTEAQCAPTCTCGGLDFKPATYDVAFIAGLAPFDLIEPFEVPARDPYLDPAPAPIPVGTVCGVVPVEGRARAYTLRTFDSRAALAGAGAQLTHFGPCGLCSPLADLAVYMGYPDLTQPVRACGVKGLTEGDEANFQCLRDLGFTVPCARIWLYNTKNTRKSCLAECLRDLDAPYHLPDGSLNACLQCDEEKSGPVFKAVAGRTRRNTGLPNAMCRPCAEANAVIHDYAR